MTPYGVTRTMRSSFSPDFKHGYTLWLYCKACFIQPDTTVGFVLVLIWHIIMSVISVSIFFHVSRFPTDIDFLTQLSVTVATCGKMQTCILPHDEHLFVFNRSPIANAMKNSYGLWVCILPHDQHLFVFNRSPIANAMKNSYGLWDIKIS